MEDLLTVEEVCKILGVSRMTIYRMWSSGTGPPKYKIAGSVRVSKKELEKFIAKQKR